jgi:ABC-type bacteriocin/lantibiotic exporter with double-glycine peptidase domain
MGNMTLHVKDALIDIARRESGWRLIFRILNRQRRGVAAILAITLGVYASSLSVPIVIQHIIDGISASRVSSPIALLAVLALALAAIDVLLADRRRALVIALGQRLDRHISLEIMGRLLGARMDMADRDTGKILNRTEQVERIKIFMIDIMPSSVFDIGGALIAGIIIFSYSVYCGIAIMVISAVGFLFSKVILDEFYSTLFSRFKLQSERQGNLAETVNGLATIKALAIEPARFRLWNAKTKTLVNTYGQTAQMGRRLFLAMGISQHLLTLAVVGVGGFEIMHGMLSTGELFAILMLNGKVAGPLLTSADVARQFQEVAVAVQELGALLDAPQERANTLAPVRAPLAGGFEFRNVVYRYKAGAAPALDGLSLRLPETGRIAIIGRNGSGKSTLLRLCQGLLREFEGEIAVGGIDIRSFHPRWLRSHIAAVNQDTVLFAGPVRDNVACWSPAVTDAEIEAALRLAGAWDFVGELPDKLDARLSENAANLSGGQRQRLAIARAVLRDPKIILLDEPTAFLDAEAAVNIEARLTAWGRGRLMILVSHHLAATRTADRIILLDKGKVSATGSHAELMETSGLYRSLWNDYLRGSGAEQEAASDVTDAGARTSEERLVT